MKPWKILSENLWKGKWKRKLGELSRGRWYTGKEKVKIWERESEKGNRVNCEEKGETLGEFGESRLSWDWEGTFLSSPVSSAGHFYNGCRFHMNFTQILVKNFTSEYYSLSSAGQFHNDCRSCIVTLTHPETKSLFAHTWFLGSFSLFSWVDWQVLSTLQILLNCGPRSFGTKILASEIVTPKFAAKLFGLRNLAPEFYQ